MLGNDEAAKASLPPPKVKWADPAGPTKFTGSVVFAPTISSSTPDICPRERLV